MRTCVSKSVEKSGVRTWEVKGRGRYCTIQVLRPSQKTKLDPYIIWLAQCHKLFRFLASFLFPLFYSLAFHCPTLLPTKKG